MNLVSVEDLRTMYETNLLSLRDISAKTGLDYSYIRKTLKDAGMQFRSYSEAEAVFRTQKPEAYQNRIARIKNSRKDILFQTSEGKQEALRDIRMYTRPVSLEHKRSHPICERCLLKPSVEVHHVRPLNHLICQYLDRGIPLETAVLEISRDHYTGKVELLAVCKTCHNKLTN